jgi:hypothetical protein
LSRPVTRSSTTKRSRRFRPGIRSLRRTCRHRMRPRALQRSNPDEEKTAASGTPVTEAAVSIRSDASATGEAVQSDAAVAPNTSPIPDSPFDEPAMSWAGVPTAASTDAGGRQEETATAVAAPALVSTYQLTSTKSIYDRVQSGAEQ